MTHLPRDTWWFVLSLIWLGVLLAAVPFVLDNHATPPFSFHFRPQPELD